MIVEFTSDFIACSEDEMLPSASGEAYKWDDSPARRDQLLARLKPFESASVIFRQMLCEGRLGGKVNSPLSPELTGAKVCVASILFFIGGRMLK